MPKRNKRRRCKHQLVIIQQGDAEAPDICADECRKCGHLFTATERKNLKDGSGIITQRDYSKMMAGL